MIPVCDWDNPGHNVYKGSPQAAIMAFEDIPLDIRKTLIFRVQNHASEYTDVVSIRKTSITGRNDYLPDISQMHFGSTKKMCATVTRAKWTDSESQSALVYCEGDYCIARPSICNNWFRVARRPPAPAFVPAGIGVPEAYPGNEGSGLGQANSGTQTQRESFSGSEEGYAYSEFAASFSAPVLPVLYLHALPIRPLVPAVPEPSTWMILIGGFLLFYFWPRKKK